MEIILKIIDLLPVILPAATGSWALIVFSLKWLQERSQSKEKQSYDMMALIDDPNRPIVGKMAAVYQLRYQQKKHNEFIVRLLQSQIGNIGGNCPENAATLSNEMQDYLRKR
ncbi:hypothetical protein LAZ29_00670 [Cereibacter sphaeroides]|uniref:hypothetical protein n=1 Tax=Cereibacter sphaeroides TaxID=1063 RepID=UPI001F3A3148|nr:hypothetical protein [Cereibacter sphaeroides]MCE6949476.1 hypothetical protein [Cereibacter sphaeroides]